MALYRGASWLLARVPLRVSEPVARGALPGRLPALAGQAPHHPWPTPRTSWACRRTTPTWHAWRAASTPPTRASRSSSCACPSLPADEPPRLLRCEGAHHERFMALWERCRAEGRGIIAVSGHIGSIEVFAGAYAQQGIPTYGLADDSAFPGALRAAQPLPRPLGRDDHPVAAPARHLPRHAPALHPGHGRGLGLPARRRAGAALRGLDDAAGRTGRCWRPGRGAVIVPVVARREPDGRYRPVMYEPIEVADGSAAELARATQAIADALEDDGRAQAPEQWYTFKPMWPASVQPRRAALAARAAGGGAGVVSAAADCRAGRPARTAAEPAPGRSPSASCSARCGLARRLPDKPLYRVAFAIGAGLSLRHAGAARAGAPQPGAGLRLARGQRHGQPAGARRGA